MSNNLTFTNSLKKHSLKQPPDILDFLDDVKKHKASSDGGILDIVDIVKAFYGLNHDIENPTMSKIVKGQGQAEPLNLLTLSRVSTMSKNLEEEIEKYQELFDERAGIYQFDGGFKKNIAEQKALNDISIIYSKQKALSLNGQEVKNFINQLTIN